MQRVSKLHYWFKSYGNFAEWVDVVNWWSFRGGGSAINGANPSSLFLAINPWLLTSLFPTKKIVYS